MNTFHVGIYSTPLVREGSVHIELSARVDAESEEDAVALLLELLSSSSFRVIEKDMLECGDRGIVVDMDSFLG